MLYETEDGRPISTNSMLSSFLHCPRQAMYKYKDRLRPRLMSKPLTRGTWVHSLLEMHYSGKDWKETHAQLTRQFENLMDEEREHLGDLPTEISNLMRGYLWHYKLEEEEGWTVLENELTVEAELPNDQGLFRGRVDMLVEDQFGLWIVDHKTHKTLPDHLYRQLDTQSPRYIWAAREMGIPVRGFIWNYIRTTPPAQPVPVKAGDRFYKNLGETDYPSLALAIKKYGIPVAPYREKLAALKEHRWQPGKVQYSPFYQRHVIEKDDYIDRVIAGTIRTHQRMHTYDFDSDRDAVERSISRQCSFMCGYQSLCTAELIGNNANNIRRQQYTTNKDPLAYYERKAGELDG